MRPADSDGSFASGVLDNLLPRHLANITCTAMQQNRHLPTNVTPTYTDSGDIFRGFFFNSKSFESRPLYANRTHKLNIVTNVLFGQYSDSRDTCAHTDRRFALFLASSGFTGLASRNYIKRYRTVIIISKF